MTGATSGIGLAAARLLAARGYDLVLLGRDQVVLQSLEQELSLGGRRVLTMAKDLTQREAAAEIVAELAQRGVAVDALVNNAGFGVHGSFAETALAAELAMVEIQVGALLQLTKAFLPGMLARGHGHILNVASVYSFSSAPFQAVYGASKAFMLGFSQALGNEVRDRGVTVTALCPGITKTKFRTRLGKPDKGKGMTAEAVAAAGIAGMLAGKGVVVPGFWNKVFVAAMRHMPLRGMAPVVRIINRIRGLVKK